MRELFELVTVTTIWVLGIKVVTHKGMVLERLGQYGERKVDEGKKIFEPLFVCAWCMSSIHSSIGYMLVYTTMATFQWRSLLMYPIVAMASSFASGMLWLIYETLTIRKKLYEKQEEMSYLDLKNRKFIFKQNQNHGSKEKFRYKQGGQESAGAKGSYQHRER